MTAGIGRGSLARGPIAHPHVPVLLSLTAVPFRHVALLLSHLHPLHLPCFSLSEVPLSKLGFSVHLFPHLPLGREALPIVKWYRPMLSFGAVFHLARAHFFSPVDDLSLGWWRGPSSHLHRPRAHSGQCPRLAIWPGWHATGRMSTRGRLSPVVAMCYGWSARRIGLWSTEPCHFRGTVHGLRRRSGRVAPVIPRVVRPTLIRCLRSSRVGVILGGRRLHSRRSMYRARIRRSGGGCGCGWRSGKRGMMSSGGRLART